MNFLTVGVNTMTKKQIVFMDQMKTLVNTEILDNDTGLMICLMLKSDEQIDKMLAYLEEHPNAEQDDIVDYAEELEEIIRK